MTAHWLSNDVDIDVLHEIGSRIAAADPLHDDLAQIVEFASAVVKCDSCFVYLREGDELVLRASKNPHEEVIDRLKVRVGQGITGWVAEHHEPVAISQNASQDVRFKFFHELPEDSYEAFLSVPILSRGRLIGVINVQHRQERLVGIFGQFVEELETNVLGGVLGNRDRLVVLGDPSSDALPHAHFQAIDHFLVGIFGSAQDQFIALAHVDKTGIALHHRGSEFDDLRQVRVQSISRCDAAAYLVQDIDIDIIGRRLGSHTLT